MKKKKFEVPQDLMSEFAEKVVELELVNRIVGVEDDIVTIEIRYEAQEKEVIYDLIEWYDENVETTVE
ncbi:MAG: hypothetical protein ACOYNC_05225 [Bacteroidales bacterium]